MPEINNPLLLGLVLINIFVILGGGIFMFFRVSARRGDIVTTYQIIDETYPVHPKYRRFAGTIENIYARQVELKLKISELNRVVNKIKDGSTAEDIKSRVNEIEKIVDSNVVDFPVSRRPI